MSRKIRLAIPILLVALGMWLLSGCIYVPMFGRPLEGQNVAKKVGSTRSDKPVRIGVSTGDDIFRIIGEPRWKSADGRVIAYSWKTQNGVTVWPLCFWVDGVDRWSTLVFQLDDEGVLYSTEILQNNEPAINILQQQAFPPLPAGAGDDQYQQYSP